MFQPSKGTASFLPSCQPSESRLSYSYRQPVGPCSRQKIAWHLQSSHTNEQTGLLFRDDHQILSIQRDNGAHHQQTGCCKVSGGEGCVVPEDSTENKRS